MVATAVVRPARFRGENPGAEKTRSQGETRGRAAAQDGRPATAKEVPKGDYWVQVASRRKRTEAETAVRKIMDSNFDLLGDQSFAVVKANIPNAGTFYRSRVGPFASFASARKMCKSLKSRRQDCLVIIR